MEEFFLLACGSDEEAELIDRFAARYGWTVPEILDLDLVTMAELYKRTREKEKEAQAWDLYLEQFRFMITDQIKYQSFREYYDHISGCDIDLRPDAEILADVEAVRRELKGG